MKFSVPRLLLLLLCCTALARAELVTGRVVGVESGETITLMIERLRSKETFRVELWGVVPLAEKQPFGAIARQRLDWAALGQYVRVTTRATYCDGRPEVASVELVVQMSECIISHFDLGELWVGGGLAWCSPDIRGTTEEARRLEADQAKAATKDKKNLWALPDPIAPWEFRRRQDARK